MTTNPPPLTLHCTIHVRARAKGRKELAAGAAPPPSALPAGRVPRVARLMALALHFEGLVRAGTVSDYATLARLGHVTRARITQVMNLLYLAPDLQEQILFLPRTVRGRDPLILQQLQPIAATPEWKQQRRLWAGLALRVAGARPEPAE